MRNLKVEELFVGAYVGVYADGCIRGPLRVTHIAEDGGVALGDGSSAPLCSLCAVQIDDAILSGFRFRPAKGDNVWMIQAGDIRLTVALRWRGGVQECRRCAISGRTVCWNEEIRYIHELQRWWNDRVYFPFDMELGLEWKGAVSDPEELT